MDKKKALTILSVLGLSGSLMFSVSALSADTVSDSGRPSGTVVPFHTVPGCDSNGETSEVNEHCDPDHESHSRRADF